MKQAPGLLDPYFTVIGGSDGNAILFQTSVDGVKTSNNTKFARTLVENNSSIKTLTLPGGATLWIPFDTYIKLEVIVKSGVCTANVTYNGQVYSASNSMWATIDPTQNYFKAGNYIQSNVADYAETPGDYSEVVIKALSVTHEM